MNHIEANRYGLPLSKPHESRVQRLRFEQKAEGERLDILKRALQAKLYADPKQTKEVLAA
jgi:hypothetical protein